MEIADNLYDDTSNVDPAERAADYAGNMAMGKLYMEKLMDIAGNDPEVIKKAFVYIEEHKQDCFLKDMPERYFSEIVWSLARAVE